MAKPGCRDRCGNVSVPFPFGLEAGCYREEAFAIICNESYNPPKAFLQINKNPHEVLDISSLDSEIVIVIKIYSKCYYNSSTSANMILFNANFTIGTRYTISSSNLIVAIGCNSNISVLIRDPTERNRNLGSCFSIGCNEYNISSPHPCSSGNISCCGITYNMASGLKELDVELYAGQSVVKPGNVSLCNNVFMLGKNSGVTTGEDGWGAPVRLHWTIGDATSCDEACGGQNKYCNNYRGNPYLPDGYRCECFNGFLGNPYLPDGCKGGFGIGVALLFLVFGGIWLHKTLMKRKHIKVKEKFFKQNGGLLLQQKIVKRNSSNRMGVCYCNKKSIHAMVMSSKPKSLSLRNWIGRLITLTRTEFSVKEPVEPFIKGMLPDGTIIAVKKSKTVIEGQIEQFINEVAILSQINHRNVVKLLGCCLETEVPLLVYEFISNGTLFQHIHDPEKKSSLSWENRLRIATEVAGALAYMHSAASIPIFHRDIKSSNILLDSQCIAKISDFGISRSVSSDLTHLTTVVQGTFGYLDPEYYYTGQFTEKSDVYSFGVVLAELLIGEKAISLERSENFRSLAAYFISSVKENYLYQIIEDRIVKEAEKEQVVAVAEVVRACLQQIGRKRPRMKEVATELEGILRSPGYPRVQENQEESELYDPSYLYTGSLIDEEASFEGFASSSTFERQKQVSLQIG